MASLTGNTIQSTYDSLLKVTDNDSITGSLKRITDGLGNNTPLYLSNSAVEIVSALNVTGAITGSNLSGTNTGDETKASIETKLGAATSSNSGYLTSTDWSTFNNKIAGTGTLNKLAKFSSSSSIADSTITDTGSAVTIGVATSVTGSLTASSIIKSGGTASQILAADGSVITAGTNITISGGTISSSGGISGSGTTNYVPKFTGSASLGNSLIFDNGTNVGIGTASPAYKLHVVGTTYINPATDYNVLFQNSGTTLRMNYLNDAGSANVSASFRATDFAWQKGDGSETMRITSGGNVGIGTSTPRLASGFTTLALNNASNGGLIDFLNNGTLAAQMYNTSSVFNIGSVTAIPFVLATSDTERMRITSGGNVGIGTTSPSYPLQVRRAGGAGSLGISIDSVGSTDRAVQYFAVQDNAAGAGSGHAFYYRAPSSTTDVLGLFLNEGGNVGIGTTSPSERLHVVGNGLFSGNLTSGANITSGTGAFDTGGFFIPYSASSASSRNWKITNDQIAFGDFSIKQSSTQAGLPDTYRFYINPTGNVGIGTTSPGQALQVNGRIRVSPDGTNGGDLAVNDGGLALSSIAAAPIEFFTSNYANERMRITSGGNVGIGTTSPSYKLDTYGQVGITSDSTEQIVIRTLTNTNRQLLIGYNYTPNYAYLQAVEQGIAYRNLILQPNGGNVGIGTSSPGTRLEIRSLAADADRTLPHNILTLTAEQNNAPYGPFGGAILFKNRSYTSGLVESARIRSVIYDDGAPNNFGGGIWFETTPTPGGALTPSLVLNYQGRVGIGTSSPSQKLDVAGNINVLSTGAAIVGSTESIFFAGTGSGNYLGFGTNNAERMRLNTSGNLLIGTTSDLFNNAKLQVNGGMTYLNLFNRRTASYTLSASDQSYIVEMNVGSANNLTVPPNSSVAFPIGTEIAVLQYGAGQTTIVAGSGVTLKSKSNALKISGQYAGCTLVKVGTDEWYVIGDLTL